MGYDFLLYKMCLDFCVSTEMTISEASTNAPDSCNKHTCVKHTEDYEVGHHCYFSEYHSLPQLHDSRLFTET